MAAEELSYVLINPYTLRKSRTGGIIARLLSRTALDLAATRMFAPSKELVQEYAATFKDGAHGGGRNDKTRQLIHDYILANYMPEADGSRHRVLMLLFRGEGAVEKVRECVGDVSYRSVTGESVRDTYGDYIVAGDGLVRYFEPAVLAPETLDEAMMTVKIWGRRSDADGGLLENVLPCPRTAKTQRTLVIIKPDNFTFPSGKAGRVIDMFSKTGLYMVAVKTQQMSVAQAEEFYGPVLPVLREKLSDVAAKKSAGVLSKEFGFDLPSETVSKLGSLVGPLFAQNQFESIVEFMSGHRPSQVPAADKQKPGSTKSVVIVYEGEDAVAKVRNVLGPTDPRKAPPGSIRREFGQDIMVNAAHASDSVENARREMGILRVAENNLKKVIEECYGKC
ncbi:MAG: nucleoside-diphosphate kinase [Verrucomicrobiae bacterium]|nr:nucleoside-diphosphate kinase [Verrucomicrobiae bacterium]